MLNLKVYRNFDESDLARWSDIKNDRCSCGKAAEQQIVVYSAIDLDGKEVDTSAKAVFIHYAVPHIIPKDDGGRD